MRLHDGLTLMELLIVLAIIAILAIVAFPIYDSYSNRSAIVPALAELRLIEHRADDYAAYNGRCLVSDANKTRYPESRFFVGYVFTRDNTDIHKCIVKTRFTNTVQSADFRNQFVWLIRERQGVWLCQTTIRVPLENLECVFRAGLDMAL